MEVEGLRSSRFTLGARQLLSELLPLKRPFYSHSPASVAPSLRALSALSHCMCVQCVREVGGDEERWSHQEKCVDLLICPHGEPPRSLEKRKGLLLVHRINELRWWGQSYPQCRPITSNTKVLWWLQERHRAHTVHMFLWPDLRAATHSAAQEPIFSVCLCCGPSSDRPGRPRGIALATGCPSQA